MSAILLVGFGALAQVPGAGGPAGMSAAVSKLFGDIKAFTAMDVLNIAVRLAREP